MSLVTWITEACVAAALFASPASEVKETALEQVDRVIAERTREVAEISRPDASPQPIREIPQARNVTWTPEQAARPLRFRVGNVTLTIRNVVSPIGEDLVQPQITVEAPDRRPRVIEGTDTWPEAQHMVGIGRLDRQGRIFVYYQGATGGAHCCLAIAVAVIDARSIWISEASGWDGGPRADFPRDVDGDGAVDIVLQDDRFRYAFGGGADSYGPPQILNIEASPFTNLVDVSQRRSMRPLFAAQMDEARRQCLGHPEDSSGQSNCAVYVAAAARVGQLDSAWQDLLRIQDRIGANSLPQACRFVLAEREDCPPEGVITFATFPEALRHFLRANGYIPI